MNDKVEPPIACNLGSGAYQDRIAWIADLVRDGLRSVNRQDLTLDLRFAREVADRVHEMVRKEQECCAFLRFEISDSGGEVRLTITAPERARDVADALFEQFVPTSFVSRASTP